MSEQPEWYYELNKVCGRFPGLIRVEDPEKGNEIGRVIGFPGDYGIIWLAE